MEPNIIPFRFKEFNVKVAANVFPVTTDSVLLGAWCTCENSRRALDIGTGSGLLSLMIAQRNELQTIIAIDTHRDSIQCAKENFFNSPWKNQLSVLHLDLNELHTRRTMADMYGTFDLVVCNPPYYSGQLLPVNVDNKRSKHAEIFDFTILFECARDILNEQGRISMVIPAEQESRISLLALRLKFYQVRSLSIRHKPGSETSIVLLEYSKRNFPLEKKSLTLYMESGERSPEYEELTDSFYL